MKILYQKLQRQLYGIMYILIIDILEINLYIIMLIIGKILYIMIIFDDDREMMNETIGD
jgi:hypothetical protein